MNAPYTNMMEIVFVCYRLDLKSSNLGWKVISMLLMCSVLSVQMLSNKTRLAKKKVLQVSRN